MATSTQCRLQSRGLIAAAMPHGKPMTIARLETIRPGETVVYYRGRLPRDAEHNPRSPAANALLATVMDTAAKLETEGRARLFTGQHTTPNGMRLNEYTALGIR